MGIGNGFDDGETETAARQIGGIAAAMEAAEERGKIVRWDTDAGVFNDELEGAIGDRGR